MTTLASWRSFARALLRRGRMERDMDSELEFHIEARTDHLVTMGLDRAAASRQARRELGDPLRWKEQGREARGLRLVDNVRADVWTPDRYVDDNLSDGIGASILYPTQQMQHYAARKGWSAVEARKWLIANLEAKAQDPHDEAA